MLAGVQALDASAASAPLGVWPSPRHPILASLHFTPSCSCKSFAADPYVVFITQLSIGPEHCSIDSWTLEKWQKTAIFDIVKRPFWAPFRCFAAPAQPQAVVRCMAKTGNEPKLKKPQGRHAITNGRNLPRSIDGRGNYSRRLADLIALYESDLGEGISQAERAIVRRISFITIELERMETQLASATDFSGHKKLDLYQRLSGTQARLLRLLGLKRREYRSEDTLASLINDDHRRRMSVDALNEEE